MKLISYEKQLQIDRRKGDNIIIGPINVSFPKSKLYITFYVDLERLAELDIKFHDGKKHRQFQIKALDMYDKPVYIVVNKKEIIIDTQFHVDYFKRDSDDDTNFFDELKSLAKTARLYYNLHCMSNRKDENMILD